MLDGSQPTLVSGPRQSPGSAVCSVRPDALFFMVASSQSVPKDGGNPKQWSGVVMSKAEAIDWKTNGVKVIPADSLDGNTPQTPGMSRAAAINHARVGAQKIWA